MSKIAELPSAEVSGDLPELPAGCEFDEIVISGWKFAIIVAKNLEGVEFLTEGNQELASRMFNRALRIACPEKLEARKLMDESKDKAQTAKDLQTAILNFNVAEVKPRAARTPKVAELPQGQETFSAEEVAAILAKVGVKAVSK